MIQLTGVASRYVGYFIALFLVLLGFFPIVGVVFSFMPDPVLGGATLLMFGTVAVSLTNGCAEGQNGNAGSSRS